MNVPVSLPEFRAAVMRLRQLVAEGDSRLRRLHGERDRALQAAAKAMSDRCDEILGQGQEELARFEKENATPRREAALSMHRQHLKDIQKTFEIARDQELRQIELEEERLLGAAATALREERLEIEGTAAAHRAGIAEYDKGHAEAGQLAAELESGFWSPVLKAWKKEAEAPSVPEPLPELAPELVFSDLAGRVWQMRETQNRLLASAFFRLGARFRPALGLALVIFAAAALAMLTPLASLGFVVIALGAGLLWRGLYAARVAALERDRLELLPRLERAGSLLGAMKDDLETARAEALAAAEMRVKQRENDKLKVRRAEVNARITQLGEEADGRSNAERRQHDKDLAEIESHLRQEAGEIASFSEQRLASVEKEGEAAEKKIKDEAQILISAAETQWNAEWERAVASIESLLARARAASDEHLRPWRGEAWKDWSPPQENTGATCAGYLEVDLATEMAFKDDTPLQRVRDVPASLPACLAFPELPSLVVATRNEGRTEASDLVRSTLLRMLASFPAGKAGLVLIDPVGLGESFAPFLRLADGRDDLLGGGVATDSRAIDRRLDDLAAHVETVIQKYLRDEYATLAEYNLAAGPTAVACRFVAIADFPAGFSDQALERLVSLARSGPRCGISLLIHWDRSRPLPEKYPMEEILGKALVLERLQGDFSPANGLGFLNPRFLAEEPVPAALASSIIDRIAAGARGGSQVRLPFARISPAQPWQESSARELRSPLGLSGAKPMEMVLGHGTSQHMLVAGKTGSGKSTLLHALVIGLCLRLPPSELELYLVDFKKGVEFKTYARCGLPHARVVAIESEREFGISVLRGLDAELDRRGRIFREAGVADMPSYRSGGRSLPRQLLVVDEFQELFSEEDRLAQEASLLLDRLVRQGRAFGVHVILASQTLAGSYSLPRATLGQMAVRVALMCSEADSMLILAEDNSAARLLDRPGEAIYNEAAGRPESNTPFQAAWISEAEREGAVVKMAALARERNLICPETVVFEGGSPGELGRNRELREMPRAPAAPRSPLALHLGEPNAIRPHVRASLARQAGGNLLIAGQDEEMLLRLQCGLLCSLAARHRAEPLELVLLDAESPECPHPGLLGDLARRFGFAAREARHTAAEIARLHGEMLRRRDAEGQSPRLVLAVNGLQRFRLLRQDDDLIPSDDAPPTARQFGELLAGGPEVGIHIVVTLDTFSSFTRWLGRRSLREFDQRVLLQMAASDAANLADGPEASRLGPANALLHSDQKAGGGERFRPYALPKEDFLATLLA
ncbi:MAG: hypothetical protein RL095_1646 [Verrucomicrobiota bacterium]|jgi:DNA segregation ATPase FtsK/SpoIIIE-like protein